MFCPKCDTIIPIVSRFCFKCGKEIKIDLAVLSDTETVPSTKFQTLVATFSIISPIFMIISAKNAGIDGYEIIAGCIFVAGIFIFLTYKRASKGIRDIGAAGACFLFGMGGWLAINTPGLRLWLIPCLILTLYFMICCHD